MCNKPSSYNLLVVDRQVFKKLSYYLFIIYSYFAEIIESNLTAKVNDVELLPDGGWRIVDEKATKKPAVNNIAGTSAPPSIVKPESVNSNHAATTPSVSAPSSAKPPLSAPEIITLDDSDESDGETSEAPPSVASSSTKAPDSRKRTYDQTFASSSNKTAQQQDFRVITLGDSDDDEPAPSQPISNNPTFPSVTK